MPTKKHRRVYQSGAFSYCDSVSDRSCSILPAPILHPTPFGSKHWQYAVPEALQRVVAMTAVQFMLFEPEGRVKGNDELKVAAEKLIDIIITQLKTLKTKKSDW